MKRSLLTMSGYRKVPCFEIDCPNQPAMELEAHLSSVHGHFYGTHRANPGKWFLDEDGDASKMWIDSESGLRFWAVLYHNEEQWWPDIIVFGGKNVAKKFRAKIRLSSHDMDSSIIFNGNVHCLDDWDELDASKQFRINNEEFKIYNKGHIGLGDHKDKNGELVLPVTVEVKMKKLNVG